MRRAVRLAPGTPVVAHSEVEEATGAVEVDLAGAGSEAADSEEVGLEVEVRQRWTQTRRSGHL